MVRRLRLESMGISVVAFIASITALFGIVLGGLSPAGAVTLPETPPTACTYNSPLAYTAGPYAHHDRCPPSARVDRYRHDADGPGSRGASARARGVIVPNNYAYDVTAPFASPARGKHSPSGRATTPSEDHVRQADEAQSPVALSGVAAETGGFVQSASSSRVLGQNLEAFGIVRPAETAAHHIVAGGAEAAAPARGMLTQYGIDINAAENGVFLPASSGSLNPLGAAVHSSLHTGAYYETVNDLLLGTTSRGEVMDSLGYLRGTLLGGGL